MTDMEYVTCEFCGKTLPESEAVFYDDGGYYACPDCWENEFVECDRCGVRIPYDEASHTAYGNLCESAGLYSALVFCRGTAGHRTLRTCRAAVFLRILLPEKSSSQNPTNL